MPKENNSTNTKKSSLNKMTEFVFDHHGAIMGTIAAVGVAVLGVGVACAVKYLASDD